MVKEGFDCSQLGVNDNVTGDDERVETLEEVLVDIQKLYWNFEPIIEAHKESFYIWREKERL